MKTIKSITFLLLGIFFTLVSCTTSNEPIDPKLNNQLFGTSATNNGGTGSTGGGTSINGDYWPAAINNQWTYSRNGVAQAPTKMISINQINGQSYYTFDNPPGGGSGASTGGVTVNVTTRLRKNVGDYFVRYDNQSFTAPTISGTQTDFEFIILKDYLSVGQTWTSKYSQTTTYNNINFPPVVTNTSVLGTIIDKGITYSSNGVSYNDVIKVKLVQTVTSIAGNSSSENYYWFAKNIGLIRVENTVANGATTVTVLNSYILN